MSHPDPKRDDDHVKLPLDPEEALRALLAVDPKDESADDEDGEGERDKQRPPTDS